MSIESIKVRDLNTTSSIGENDLLLVAKTDGTTQNVKISDLSLFVESTVDGLGAVTFSSLGLNTVNPASTTVSAIEVIRDNTNAQRTNSYMMKFSFSNGAFTTVPSYYDHGSVTSPSNW
jgi:hypothetical protein